MFQEVIWKDLEDTLLSRNKTKWNQNLFPVKEQKRICSRFFSGKIDKLLTSGFSSVLFQFFNQVQTFFIPFIIIIIVKNWGNV